MKLSLTLSLIQNSNLSLQLIQQMPPKKTNKIKALNAKKSAAVIPIYEMLIDKDSDNAIEKLNHQLDKAYEFDQLHSDNTLSKSMFILVFKMSGLQSICSRFDSQHPFDSLKDIIEELNQDPQLAKDHLTDSILNARNEHYSILRKRFKLFLGVLLSQDLQIVFDNPLLSQLCQWMRIMSKCKIRTVVAVVFQIIKFIIERQCIFTNELIESKKESKESIIGENINEYLNIIKERIKEVDSGIRQLIFSSVLTIMTKLPHQFITLRNLQSIFTPIIIEGSNIASCVKTLKQIYFNAPPEKLKDLIAYGTQNLKILSQMCLMPNIVGVDCLRIMLTMFKADHKSGVIQQKFIQKLFEAYGAQDYQLGLQLAIEVFYCFLAPKMQKIDSKIVIAEIINLLGNPNCKNAIKPIVNAFMFNKKQIFVFSDLFILLLSQFYTNESGNDIEFGFLEIENLIGLIIQITDYLRINNSVKQKQWVDEAKENYNQLLINNQKEILGDKISKYPFLQSHFLSLYSHIFSPLNASSIVHLNSIINRTQSFFIQSNDRNVISEAVKIFHAFNSHSIELLTNTIHLKDIQPQHPNSQITIVKVSCILAKYCYLQFINEELIKRIFHYFFTTDNTPIKMQIIQIAYLCNLWMMKNMVDNSSYSCFKSYQSIRAIVLEFLYKTLEKEDSKIIIKISIFTTLCKVLKLCNNSKIYDIQAIYYELPNQEEKLLTSFAEENMHLDMKNKDDLSMIMENMSFLDTHARNEVIIHLLELYQTSYRLASTKRAAKILCCLLIDANYQPLVEGILLNFVREQVETKNDEVFVFWKVGWQMMNFFDLKQGKKQQMVNKLVQLYFKKKGSPVVQKIKMNKLILFLAQAIDKSLADKLFQRVQTCELILKKAYRRFNKIVLHRLSLFVESRTNNQENPHVLSLKKYLAKISLQNTNNQENQNDQNREDDKNQDEQKDSDEQVVVRRSMRKRQNKKK